MNKLRLYDKWEAATFIKRENRFTLLLLKQGGTFRAYIPNTGRMEEFLVEDSKFFVSPFKTKKFQYRVVSTQYQNNFILLDTIKMNTLAGHLIEKNLLPDLMDIKEVQREKAIGNIRPDFLLTRRNNTRVLLEVKTCTFCHNGVAMFPDAPSQRAYHHIESLHELIQQGYDTRMVFIIPNKSAGIFMPNFHTDHNFALKVLEEKIVKFNAYRVDLVDPVTVDLESIHEVSIDYDYARLNNTPSGSYLLVLKNDRRKAIEVGKLGKIYFNRGYYVYVGSAMSGLESRVARHAKKKKKCFWHIDFITPGNMDIEKVFIIRRADRIESKIAERVGGLCTNFVNRFGASDSSEKSHLFYFQNPPHRTRDFMNIVLDFKTFSDLFIQRAPH